MSSHVMKMDGCEVQVSIEDGEVLLDIEQIAGQWLIVAMTRVEAMGLGGLLIGMATALADEVPLDNE